ncbi:MAG: carboxymuconolactone decarboxylase family protein [Dehalococcoidia bacterium]
MARLPLANRDDFPEELRYVWDRTSRGDAPPNIFRVMGNNPALLRNYLRLGNSLWGDSHLETATRELVILRTAYLSRSVYEWHQHVTIGRQAGLADEKINALQNWPESELFSEQERELLAYVDAVAESAQPRQELHDGLAAHFPGPTIMGVNLLVGFYMMTARFLGGMEVETEEPFIGWQL